MNLTATAWPLSVSQNWDGHCNQGLCRFQEMCLCGNAGATVAGISTASFTELIAAGCMESSQPMGGIKTNSVVKTSGSPKVPFHLWSSHET